MGFYYKKGNIETTKPWITPPPLDNVNAWWNDFKKNDLEDYKVYIVGKYPVDHQNTNDVDICLTGPIYDYNKLQKLLEIGTDLGINKHNILIDICWFDNINFCWYPKDKNNFSRNHLRIVLAGKEIKKIDKKVVYENNFQTTLNDPDIPKGLAMNVIIFPEAKHKNYGVDYGAIPKKEFSIIQLK